MEKTMDNEANWFMCCANSLQELWTLERFCLD